MKPNASADRERQSSTVVPAGHETEFIASSISVQIATRPEYFVFLGSLLCPAFEGIKPAVRIAFITGAFLSGFHGVHSYS
ncbi:hypothetical protein [Pseudorhodobacter sp. E13]|uniref:hypothetical protein n=1 Tax=Pseudorhodobacter sp. E13 TaxID=2487931 RepID=UPI001F1F2475|nr:hypothetical protein [Pseudorhodobacter sp. E13]